MRSYPPNLRRSQIKFCRTQREEHQAQKIIHETQGLSFPLGLCVQITAIRSVGLPEQNGLAERTDRSLPAILRAGRRSLPLAQLLDDGDGRLGLRRDVSFERGPNRH